VNLQINQALLGHGMSHLDVIETLTIGREEYTAHGLHLNSIGKKKFTFLIANKLDGGPMSGVSSISVIIRATASPFLE
jgi:hypothetical protein